ncbi:MAG TPA: choice-of-anchor tandem repeat GloVer-containing protein [Puia sp.]|jgi:uncharacterized repeat protein (TIGR03803 family)|nr:choice-of-anchor tandem repeat GloVer-containing protein [Puia sp.]
MRPLYYVLYLLLFLLSRNGAFAQQTKIYGTTTLGGANGVGVLYSMNTDGTNYQVLYNFQNSPDGAEPYGKMIPGPGGKLYGATALGGSLGFGALYSWDTVAQAYSKLVDLDSVHGATVEGDLVYYNGKFYGLGGSGGAYNYGTIFSYDPVSGTLADVYDFSAAMGARPSGTITVYNNVFYFESVVGAAYGTGSIMSFDPATGTAVDIYDFGPDPAAGFGMVQLVGYNGLLYGTTNQGVPGTLGCIFSLDPRTGAFKDLYNFDSYYWGQYPEQLAVYKGVLYGVAWYGGESGVDGTLYSFDPVAIVYTKLYDWQADYQPYVDGANPVGPVAIDSVTGILYGQTSADGPSNAGVIYSYDLNANAYNILFQFNWTPTGGGPKSGFILQ